MQRRENIIVQGAPRSQVQDARLGGLVAGIARLRSAVDAADGLGMRCLRKDLFMDLPTVVVELARS